MGTATHAILRVLSTYLYTGKHRSACLRFGERIGSAILPGPAWLLLNIMDSSFSCTQYVHSTCRVNGIHAMMCDLTTLYDLTTCMPFLGIQ